ncbi:MAG TPA: thioredoxin domain-containing protein [Aggregatilineales bacterium]|nr:thioredoxin domain-containing protein [Aggregatilineales bacterium]
MAKSKKPNDAPSSKPAVKNSTAAASAPRSRTAERRQERLQQQRRQRIIIGVVGLIAVAAIAGLLAVVLNTPAEAPVPDYALTRYEGLPTDVNESGFPRIGQTSNTVVVQELSSFSCPACAVFHEQVFPSLLERITAGDISYVYVPLLTGSVPNAQGAARAGICAAEQGVFWPYHDMLFSWQGQFGNSAFAPKRLEAGAEAVGMDVAAFNSCLTSDRAGAVLTAANARANAVAGFTGTPSITVNGVLVEGNDLASVNAAIDNALALLRLTTPPVTEQPAGDEPAVTEEAPAAEESAATEEKAATEEAAVTEEPAATEEVTPEPTPNP